MRTAFLFPADEQAAAYWALREFKKWTVTVTAGPAKRPTYSAVMFVRAKTRKAAEECAKRNMVRRVPGARFCAHLATARDLGCVETPPLRGLYERA
ncbi:hypothetical protein ACVNIS_24930 (plasmid) [Sphaerotilaceae bacterium SBD11-9]